MTDLKDQVPGSELEGVSTVETAETPNQGGVTPQVTPNQQPAVDVEKLIAKYETDLNQMKSTFQRREAQANAEWRRKETELQQQIHQTRMSTMTAEEREKYEVQLQSEEMVNLQMQLEEMQNEKALMGRTLEGIQFFVQRGVPVEKLNLTGGYEALVQSGWDHITNELNTLRQKASNPQSQSQLPAPLKEAPSVITDKGVPAQGTTWEALRKRFGSDENVYRAVEEGRLSPSVIPPA